MPLYTLSSSPTLEEGRGTRQVPFEAPDDIAAIEFARTAPEDLLVSSPVRVAVQANDGYLLWSAGRASFGLSWV